MLLDIKNIDVLYDDFQVIWDVSINVKKAEMVALLGPNGSGKSTILNTISNLVQHKNGSIHFDNNLISKVPTHKRTALGISHVLERRRVFPHLTVMQNLLLGAWHPAAKKELNNSLNKIYKISGIKIGSPLPIKKLNSIISKLEKMSDIDKTLTLKLNPDRIDVIVPAGKIYQFLLNSIGACQIEVPKIGLADGMVSELLNDL